MLNSCIFPKSIVYRCQQNKITNNKLPCTFRANIHSQNLDQNHPKALMHGNIYGF